MYITINDIEVDGRRRPFEIFINSKNLDHYSWTLALTRMISAVFRRGGDISFVVEELKAVFDPQGGRWMDGRYVPSLLAAIGDVIETHLVRIGAWLAPEGGDSEHRPMNKQIEVVAAGEPRGEREQRAGAGHPLVFEGYGNGIRGRACPRCGASTFLRVEGCWVCRTCGHSSCG
jgi:ribonucleoside-diphosphate reductase alpha chain